MDNEVDKTKTEANTKVEVKEDKEKHQTNVIVKDTEKAGKGVLVWFVSQSFSTKALMIIVLLFLIAFASVFIFNKESKLINMLKFTTSDSVKKQEELIDQMRDQNIDLQNQIDRKNKQLSDSDKTIKKLKGQLSQKEDDLKKIKPPETEAEAVQRFKSLGYNPIIRKDVNTKRGKK